MYHTQVYRNLLDSRRAFGEIWGQVSNGLLNFEETPPVERARGPLQRLDGNQSQYQPRLSDVIGNISCLIPDYMPFLHLSFPIGRFRFYG